MAYVIYLRKSRADLEAEAHGEGETLLRHEKALLDLAKRQHLPIAQIYREIVSGDTIASRPMMQQLLAEIESGMWAGVLVMEVERLARGDTIDQGLVAQAFKCSGTKIITPAKTYDPNNEFDEEYFEFGLFMSRREYKTINRRLQQGRKASAKEGKFLGSRPPYGYRIVKLNGEKGNTLEIIPEQAEIVRLIFSMYVDGIIDEYGHRRRLGIQQIARKLNEMKVPPCRYDYWQKATIRDILINPTYAGKIRWGWRAQKRKIVDGSHIISRPRSDEYVLADGKHEAIISNDVFSQAQEYFSSLPPAPVGYKNQLKNPLAGIIVCGKCGRKMVFRAGGYAGSHKKKDYIVCHSRACPNVSSPYGYIEDALLNTLRDWLEQYKVVLKSQSIYPDPDIKAINRSIKSIDAEISTLKKQLSSIYDLLEQGIYSTDKFLERSNSITDRINTSQEALGNLQANLDRIRGAENSYKDFIPKIEHLLSVYNNLPSADSKNRLLKEVLDKVVYTKDASGSSVGVSATDFELKLYPKLPQK